MNIFRNEEMSKIKSKKEKQYNHFEFVTNLDECFDQNFFPHIEHLRNLYRELHKVDNVTIIRFRSTVKKSRLPLARFSIIGQ